MLQMLENVVKTMHVLDKKLGKIIFHSICKNNNIKIANDLHVGEEMHIRPVKIP